MDPRDLRHDRAELGQIDVDPPPKIANELGVARNGAAHGAKCPAETEVAELTQDRPGERRGDAGERLAYVRVAPDDFSTVHGAVAPRASAASCAGNDDRSRLKDVQLVLGERPLDIAGVSEMTFDANREIGQVQKLLLAQRRRFALRRRDRDFAYTTRSFEQGSLSLVANDPIA